MPSYRVVLAIPAVVSFTVELDAPDQASAMANALDAAARLAPGQSLPLVSSEAAGARIEACTRLEQDCAQQRVATASGPAKAFRVCFYPDAASARRAHESGFGAPRESAPPEDETRVVFVEERAKATAMAARVLDGSDPSHTARVFHPNGMLLYQAVNPYGPIALVTYATLEAARAHNDEWQLLEGWQADLRSARRRALEVLEQGFVRAVGIAVRAPEAPGHGLRVHSVLETAQ